MADNPNKVNLSLAAYFDAFNPFSPGSLWRVKSDALYDSYKNDLKSGGVGQYLSSYLKNATFGLGPVYEAKSPLSETQINYFGDRAYEDAKRAGADETQARAAKWEVKNFAATINQGNHDASLGGILENNIPDIPDVTHLSTIVLLVVLGVVGLVIYNEVK